MEFQQGHEWKEFNRLYKELDDLYHELAANVGMSDSAFCIMYAIVEMGDGCLQKDISKQYSLSKQTINSSIQNLKKKGYISLVQGKGQDKHIYLTDAGQQIAEEKILPVINMENEVLLDMTPKESQELLRLTRKYIHLLRKKTEQDL